MTFIDVGANLSYFPLLAADLVRASGQVRAFEPAQRMWAILSYNTGYYRNITVQQQALWPCRTQLPFHEYRPRAAALSIMRTHRLARESALTPTRLYYVRCISLDEYCTAFALAPDFIKIDVETAEPEILAGSMHMPTRHRPSIAQVADHCERASCYLPRRSGNSMSISAPQARSWGRLTAEPCPSMMGVGEGPRAAQTAAKRGSSLMEPSTSTLILVAHPADGDARLQQCLRAGGRRQCDRRPWGRVHRCPCGSRH
jgi:FkbM family methyltransferase